jgi:hypothetical protein
VDVNVFRPCLLLHLELVDREVKVSEVGGMRLVVSYLEGFFQECASPEAAANVLSMAAIDDLYPVTYVPQEYYFLVHLLSHEVQF